ncbi:flagellar hook-length control protein FliK [Hahella aquimaris]|uniref:flagellar hook-length control protein FliK n=1 Tax=Hahella sp. HNIBRBA332 TaxID=3015983 RepID=UPI00273BA73B|nr:flagellar hook-length control protein FliK [Hahella sp. HNIBRBA332]WLQ14707.1 flagellar hook-length control protein FliK [Hahella sp. HNIBRBA332]
MNDKDDRFSEVLDREVAGKTDKADKKDVKAESSDEKKAPDDDKASEDVKTVMQATLADMDQTTSQSGVNLPSGEQAVTENDEESIKAMALVELSVDEEEDADPTGKSALTPLARAVHDAVEGDEGDEENAIEKKGGELIKLTQALTANSKGGGQEAGADGETLDAALLKLAESQSAAKPNALHGVAANIRAEFKVDAAAPPYVTTLQQPVQGDDWGEGMAQKVVWFVGQKIQSASVHLNPPELGPIEMKIHVQKDQAHVQIQSPHAIVRDMAEGTAHRLRELLAEQGLQLSQFDVSSQQQQTGTGSGQESGGADGGLFGGEGDEEGAAVAGIEQALATDRMVDYYV